MRPERRKERIVSIYREQINIDAGWSYPNLNVYPENGDKVILKGWSRNRRIYTVKDSDKLYNRLILRYGNVTIVHP